MTRLLQRAFRQAAKLPRRDQDALAARLLEEIASERRWDELFARSGRQLAILGEKALAEHRSGRTRPLVVRGK